VKKEAKLSASEMPGEVVGSSEDFGLPCQRRLRLSEAGIVRFFGRQDELVERLEGGPPVSSRVSTFPDVFSMAEGGAKCTEVVENQGLMETDIWRVW